MKLIKQSVKFKYKDSEGKTRFATVTTSGRTIEELNGRIAKLIDRRTNIDKWELR